MKLHIVMHESFESPGAIETWARQKGCQISYTRCYELEGFPNPKEIDFLAVMGGPQSPDTTPAGCSHFNAEGEIHFIKKAVEENKLLLGVCLGAGMIQNSAEELETHKCSPYVQSPNEMRAWDYNEMNRLLFRFLDGFTALSGTGQTRP